MLARLRHVKTLLYYKHFFKKKVQSKNYTLIDKILKTKNIFSEKICKIFI